MYYTVILQQEKYNSIYKHKGNKIQIKYYQNCCNIIQYSWLLELSINWWKSDGSSCQAHQTQSIILWIEFRGIAFFFWFPGTPNPHRPIFVLKPYNKLYLLEGNKEWSVYCFKQTTFHLITVSNHIFYYGCRDLYHI